MSIMIRNNTAGEVTWNGKVLEASESYAIPKSTQGIWASDATVLQAINEGDAVISTGVDDLSPSEGLAYLFGVLIKQGGNISVLPASDIYTVSGETVTGHLGTRVIFEDFLMSDIGTSHQPLSFAVLTANGGTGILESTTPANDYQGVVILSTGTTNNNIGRAFLRATEGRNVWTLAGAKTGKFNYHEWRIMMPTLFDGTTSGVLRLGLQSEAIIGPPIDGVYLRYSNDVNSGRWTGVSRSSSIESSVNSSIPVVAGQWYTVTFKCNSAGTSVEFFIDGTSIGAVTTNIPTVGLCPVASIEKQGTNSNLSRSVYVDYFYNLKERI